MEALIALVVSGAGMLALSQLQFTLTHEADLARQRAEAMRLAQGKVEQFRSFTAIGSNDAGQGLATVSAAAPTWNSLASGTDTVQGTTNFQRHWTWEGTLAQASRPLRVQVQWSDSTGRTQTLSVSTMLSKTDPADSGRLGLSGEQGGTLRWGNGRNPAIPVSAVDLGNGESALAFGNAGQYLLLNHLTGEVSKVCTLARSAMSGSELLTTLNSVSSPSGNCVASTGVLLSGYISRDPTVTSAQWAALQNGLGIDTRAVVRTATGLAAIRCQLGEIRDGNSGAALSAIRSYLCVIPLRAVTEASSLNANWSGTVRVAGPASWQTARSPFYVCRYEYAPTAALTDPNQRHVQPYAAVRKSLAQQNYLIAANADTAGTAAPQCPQPYGDGARAPLDAAVRAVLHQDCRSASNPRNFNSHCPVAGAE